MQKNRKNIFGLIVAAGLSGRMGAYKPLLNYQGKTFIKNIIEKMEHVCNQIIIVTGFHSDEIKTAISISISKKNSRKIKFIFNDDFENGMFSSLQKGSVACSNADWVLYHFVDQPSLPSEFYTEFVQQIDEKYDWIQPIKNGRKGHPILFGKEIHEKISNASTDSNLRKISHSINNKKYWSCNYEQIFDDIDNIQDYNKLIEI